jgi:hypothetical protein
MVDFHSLSLPRSHKRPNPLSFADRLSPRFKQRGILWVLLVAHVVLLGGIPAMQSTPKSDAIASGERFPCENCPCGCSTAEFCWDQCCCHSDAEKIQWAKANAITPPKFLTDRVAASETPQTQQADLCSDAPADSSCCCCKAKPETKKTAAQPATTSVVLFWKAAQCRGIDSIWKLLSIAIPVNATKVFGNGIGLTDRFVLADESFESPRLAPTPPVPWPEFL